ncbi:hypothetical protein BST61_g6094 [Cercospora zeina]
MATYEPVAIIGYAYRSPGVGRKNLNTFLEEGRSAWSKIPKQRFNQDAYYHPNKDRNGLSHAKGGCFLPDDLYAFDATFFNMRAEEARTMDPQHRQILECAFEAAEHAGITIDQLVGTNVGVFAATDISEHAQQAFDDPYTNCKYTATGGAACMFSNRVSYFFDLEGPSLTVDAACAGSVSALHMALREIRAGTCTTAFVAASNLMLNHAMWCGFDTMGALGAEGRSFPYDAKAEGFGRGEGSGCLLVKRLADAIRDGDPIHAVVANTACNHGGRTDGITAPSREAQQKLLRRVHREIGWDPTDTPVVEGHGTGTPLGDPIEASSIATVLGANRTAANPVYLGSLKSNIGHTESVSGVLAIIKAIMQLQQGAIFPTAGFETINPAIEGKEKLRVLSTTAPWPENEKKRICINNFGFGGSNASALLEAYAPDGPSDTALGPNNAKQLFAFSAKNEGSLRTYLSTLQAHLRAVRSLPSTTDLAYTLGSKRNHFTYRTTVAATDIATLSDALASAADCKLQKSRSLQAGFVFTGQGAQYPQMTLGLRKRFPIFADTLAQAEQFLSSFSAPWSLLEELEKPEGKSRVHDPDLSQPLCTALQIAILHLLRDWGIMPAAVTGHSSGEIAAAYAAGFFSFKTAMALAYFRGKAAKVVAANEALKGGMLALGVSVEDAEALLPQSDTAYATIAAINSPRSVTVSGDVAAIESIETQAKAQGHFARRLKINVAYHSRHMETVAAAYMEDIEPYYLDASQADTGVEFYSSVTGRRETRSTINASYWVKNLVQPVCFSDSVGAMLAVKQPNILVELGPHSALKGPTVQVMEESSSKPAYLGTLIRGTPGVDALLEFAGAMFEAGADVDFAKINSIERAKVLTNLPAYEWNKSERYANESRITLNKQDPGSPFHELLGWRMPYTEGKDVSFRQVFTLDDMPWLRGHSVAGEVILPFAGYLALAVEAVRHAGRWNPGTFTLREVHARRSLKVEEDERIDLTTRLTPLVTGSNSSSASAYRFQIMTWTSSRGWLEHCDGQIDTEELASVELKSPTIDSARKLLRRSDLQPLDTQAEYTELARCGLNYGPEFRLMTKAWTVPGGAIHEVSLGEPNTDDVYNICSNPCFTDSWLHTTVIIESMSRGGPRALLVPNYFKEIRTFPSVTQRGHSNTLTAVVEQKQTDEKLGSIILDIVLFAKDAEGNMYPVCELLEATARSLNAVDGVSHSTDALAEGYSWSLEPYQQTAESELAGSRFNICGALADSQELEFAQRVVDQASKNGLDVNLKQLLQVEPEKGTYFAFIDNPTRSIATDMSEEDFKRIRSVLLESAGLLWIVPDGSHPDSATMKGFLRSLRIEDASKPLLYLEGVPRNDTGAETVLKIAARLDNDFLLDDQEFVYASDELYVPRLIADAAGEGKFDTRPKQVERGLQKAAAHDETNTLQMTVDAVGSLDSIYYRRVNLLESPLGEDEVLIKVQATGVNFRDLLLVLGSMPWHSPGLEGVGIATKVGSKVTRVKPGDRVFHMWMQEGYADHVRTPIAYVQKYPDWLSPSEMASIPVAYCTAYWCLVRVAKVQKGETVLIHAASGAVGQACITVGQHLGADVFVTAGSDVKRDFLHEKFSIPRNRIFSSRNASFRNEILCATEGKGMDVIVNSLSGSLLEQTWLTIAAFGRFVEIGKRDLLANNYIGLRPFANNVSFHAIDLRQFLQRPQIVQECLADIVELLERKVIQPSSPITEIPISDVPIALRKLQTGQNIGKVVVTIPEGVEVYGEQPKIINPPALLKTDATYLITGGTGGIGRSLAEWMLDQGAQNVVLLGRSGGSSPEVAELLQKYAGSEVQLRAVKCNVGDKSSLKHALAEIADLPAVGGVIHGAVYLRDAFLINTTYDDWKKITAPKINAAWNLHELCPNLDFFVNLASIAGVTGNAGQTIYAGTTTFLEAFAKHRRSLGMPAITINLPVISDAGIAVKNNLSDLLRQTIGVWLDTRGVQTLVRDAILASKDMSTMELQSRAATSFIRSPTASGTVLPWERFEMFSAMKNTSASSRDTTAQHGRNHTPETFIEALMARVCTLTMLDADEVTPDGDLNDYGLDSLVSVELRNWITRETGVEVALNQILSMGSLNKVVEFVFK